MESGTYIQKSMASADVKVGSCATQAGFDGRGLAYKLLASTNCWLVSGTNQVGCSYDSAYSLLWLWRVGKKTTTANSLYLHTVIRATSGLPAAQKLHRLTCLSEIHAGTKISNPA